MEETDAELEIPAGALLTFTTGSYSDYTIMGVFLALKPLNIAAERAAFLERHPEKRGTYNYETKFFADLVRLGCVEPVDCFEDHLEGHDYYDVTDLRPDKGIIGVRTTPSDESL